MHTARMRRTRNPESKLLSGLFHLLKRLEMIPGLAQALFAVLNGFRAAVADARHAVGAVAAPDRLAILNRDVVRWAELGTLTAAGAGIADRKGVCFDEKRIENRIHWAAH